ncbi:flagellin [Candidatus Phycosocius spiralis]|uniref:Flagellin n=1 Tax=Candidatus Phycosocius spiralis TaxID=2815099 RepID=A0ABQ4PTW2_9PROT|nr:flagellin [Candidatus Phycosocius spiralis]GIU66339.1 flagellin FljO [Candidatus Phycosocius spiralis]
MISVNTNIGSMKAIQNLAETNRNLNVTQKAVSTGKKVADVKDNGAIWTIGNKMSSDVTAYARVTESGERAGAILDTAIAAAESIMDLLNQMKGKALAAKQPGLSAGSQSALDSDFKQLRDQITTAVVNASFDGANMVNGGGTNTLADAIALGNANGDPATNITVSGANLNLGGTIITVAANQAVDTTTNADTALTALNASITNLGTQMATWGAGAKRFDAHLQFVSKLTDALNTGIGSILDADLSKESARLTSLQTKQQLGVQALSIANSSTQTALSLFR